MRYLTAGFSHGEGYVAIIEGLPAGLKIDQQVINTALKNRQLGQGRSERMSAENDTIHVISGLIDQKTVGAPVAFLVKNAMHDKKTFTVPRIGHADFGGAMKYNLSEISSVSEVASGRETAMAVAVGAICEQLLSQIFVFLDCKVVSVGGQTNPSKIKEIIDDARAKGDTVGGSGQVFVRGLSAGLGSYVQRDRRLDGKIAGAVMAIPSVKAVEFGLGKGFESAFGSQCLDEFCVADCVDFDAGGGCDCVDGGGLDGSGVDGSGLDGSGLYDSGLDGSGLNGLSGKGIKIKRKSNYSGGIDGGMTNGEEIVVGFSIKPPPTLKKGLDSVDLAVLKGAKTPPLRSDVCIVESVTQVARAVVAFEVANEILATFSCDTVDELKASFVHKANQIADRLN